MDYTEQNGVRHKILETLKYAKYFLDVQERKKGGLSILVSKPFDGEHLGKIINNYRKQHPAYEIRLELLSKLHHCFAWFGDSVTSNYTPEFLATYHAAEKAIKEEMHQKDRLYKEVKLMERGKSRAILEFAHFYKGNVNLYKIAASKRKDKRKRKSLEQAVLYLEKHFWQGIRKAKGYIVRPSPDKIKIDCVLDQKCRRKRR